MGSSDESWDRERGSVVFKSETEVASEAWMGKRPSEGIARAEADAIIETRRRRSLCIERK